MPDGKAKTVIGININGMQVGDDIPNDILLQLRGIPDILDVRLIHCEG